MFCSCDYIRPCFGTALLLDRGISVADATDAPAISSPAVNAIEISFVICHLPSPASSLVNASQFVAFRSMLPSNAARPIAAHRD
jgi:hypothetical protein